MKQVHRPVNMITDATGNPSKFDGPRRPVTVRRILDSWRYGGRWWVNEPPRDYYLLELETGHIFEVYRAGDVWTLSRISD